MVNSSWTRKHIRQLWWKLDEARRVFPPCNTKSLQTLPLERPQKPLYIISVAQFRPEKDHALQLEALALARKNATRCNGATGKSRAHLQLLLESRILTCQYHGRGTSSLALLRKKFIGSEYWGAWIILIKAILSLEVTEEACAKQKSHINPSLRLVYKASEPLYNCNACRWDKLSIAGASCCGKHTVKNSFCSWRQKQHFLLSRNEGKSHWWKTFTVAIWAFPSQEICCHSGVFGWTLSALLANMNVVCWNAVENVLSVRLIMVGSCRGPADQSRIDTLKKKALELGLQVFWQTDLPWEDIFMNPNYRTVSKGKMLR